MQRASRPGIRRSIRIALVAALVGLAAGAVAAPAAQASPSRVLVQLTDPLSTDPVRLQIAAADADGLAAPFSGTVALVVGGTRSQVKVSSTDGQEEIEIPTSMLTQGSATAVARLRIGGRTVTVTTPGFIDIPSAVQIQGFGCGVISPTQTRIAWQVTSVNGDHYDFPAWTPSADTFPAYVRTVHPWRITDTQGRPVTTRGTVVVRRGTTVVATIRLPAAYRRLLFSEPWPGRRTPGTYTATLTLTDRLGRVMTATQTLLVTTSSAGLCA